MPYSMGIRITQSVQKLDTMAPVKLGKAWSTPKT